MDAASPRLDVRIAALLSPVLTPAGFDLDSVQVERLGRRSVVRVVVDSDTLDATTLAEATHLVAGALDEHDPVPGAYTLEVSSPGVDRPLTLPRHWARNRGRLVVVSRVEGPAVTGRITDADTDAGGGVTLTVAGATLRLDYAQIRRGLVQVEFSRPAGTEPGETDDELGDDLFADDELDGEADEPETEVDGLGVAGADPAVVGSRPGGAA